MDVLSACVLLLIYKRALTIQTVCRSVFVLSCVDMGKKNVAFSSVGSLPFVAMESSLGPEWQYDCIIGSVRKTEVPDNNCIEVSPLRCYIRAMFGGLDRWILAMKGSL